MDILWAENIRQIAHACNGENILIDWWSSRKNLWLRMGRKWQKAIRECRLLCSKGVAQLIKGSGSDRVPRWGEILEGLGLAVQLDRPKHSYSPQRQRDYLRCVCWFIPQNTRQVADVNGFPTGVGPGSKQISTATGNNDNKIVYVNWNVCWCATAWLILYNKINYLFYFTYWAFTPSA